MMKTKNLFSALALIFSLGATQAEATLNIAIHQEGNAVVVNGSGSLDLSGLTPAGGPYDGSAPGLYPMNGMVRVGNTTPPSRMVFSGFSSSPANFGNGGFIRASSGSGTYIEANRNSLSLDASYSSGTNIEMTNTFDDTDLTTLGLTPGTYTWVWSTDTIVMEITGGSESSVWAGYAVDEDGFADTEGWVGLLYVEHAPWVWSYRIQNWIYLPEEWATGDGAWTLVLQPDS